MEQTPQPIKRLPSAALQIRFESQPQDNTIIEFFFFLLYAKHNFPARSFEFQLELGGVYDAFGDGQTGGAHANWLRARALSLCTCTLRARALSNCLCACALSVHSPFVLITNGWLVLNYK